MIYVFINMTGTPEGSTESGFMEKPGIEFTSVVGVSPNLIIRVVVIYSFAKLKKKRFHLSLNCNNEKHVKFSSALNQNHLIFQHFDFFHYHFFLPFKIS